MVHHLPGQHVATVQVHLGIDLRAEPDGADGIATVLAATMEHGSNAGGGAAEFADRVAACGIDWSTDTDHTGPRITCHLPATELGPALALITEAIGDPALRPADIAAQTQLLCGRILQTSVDAAARARRELPGVVFDPATRAGRPADGTLDTLQQLTPHAVTDFHRTHAAATAASSVVTIAGDLSGIDIDADIDRHLTDNVLRPWNTSPTSCDTTNADTTNAETPHTGTGDGTGQDAACDAWPTARLRPDPAAVFIEQPGAPQTYLMLAAPTIGRGHQDWPALAVAAYILGAPITGRLDAALREDKGFSYGIHAGQTDLLPGHGAFLAHGAVDADATVVALADLQNIMRSAHDGGFTDAECTAARNGICASLPLLYENAALVAAQTTQLAAHGLPHDFITQTLTTINNLTAQDINDAFRCHFDPSRLSMIAIGDPAQRQPLGEHLAADLRVLPA
jgi:predicted Zn-dependent peptidase